MTVDHRTRNVRAVDPIDPAVFWETAWREATAHNGARAAADAATLGLSPLAITVDNQMWTLCPQSQSIDVTAGHAAGAPAVGLDREAFTDWVTERRTGLGLTVAGRVEGDPDAIGRLCAWDPVVRSLLDSRPVYRPGDITLRAADGEPLRLDRRFGMSDDDRAEAAHFLAKAGFVLLQGVYTPAEMDAVDADLARAVDAARPDDGESWWAATSSGEQYPCRILDFATKSPALRALIHDPRFGAIGDLLGDGHQPGDPFGEHFAAATGEGLVKRVDTTQGLACLPWHKDCERGGHSMFCCGITVGICLTPVDEAHGGLDVIAGSHRANIARTQWDSGLDLPEVTLRADRGDVTVHLSCMLHRSTHPTASERRVAYTGLALPLRAEDRHDEGAQPALRRDRAAIGDNRTAARLATPR